MSPVVPQLPTNTKELLELAEMYILDAEKSSEKNSEKILMSGLIISNLAIATILLALVRDNIEFHEFDVGR